MLDDVFAKLLFDTPRSFIPFETIDPARRF
jgi:hypothetical protein